VYWTNTFNGRFEKNITIEIWSLSLFAAGHRPRAESGTFFNADQQGSLEEFDRCRVSHQTPACLALKGWNPDLKNVQLLEVLTLSIATFIKRCLFANWLLLHRCNVVFCRFLVILNSLSF